MTNREIRVLVKERQKRKEVRGIIPAFFTYLAISIGVQIAITIPLTIAQLRTGIEVGASAPKGSIWMSLIPALVTGLIGGAGMARVSLVAWNTGRAEVENVFYAFTSLRRMMRALAPMLITSAITLALAYLPIARLTDTYQIQQLVEGGTVDFPWDVFSLTLIVSFCATIFNMVIWQLYYTILLWPDTPIVEVVLHGLGQAIRAFGRLFGMGFMIFVIPYLICGCSIICDLVISMFSTTSGVLLMFAVGIGMIIYIIAIVLPRLLLCYAALAVEIFGDRTPGVEADQ